MTQIKKIKQKRKCQMNKKTKAKSLQKERTKKDVRYQEFNEITPRPEKMCKETSVRGLFHFYIVLFTGH